MTDENSRARGAASAAGGRSPTPYVAARNKEWLRDTPIIVALYEAHDLLDEAAAVRACVDRAVARANGSLDNDNVDERFCRNRLCPRCELRNASKRQARSLIRQFHASKIDPRYVHACTLTLSHSVSDRLEPLYQGAQLVRAEFLSSTPVKNAIRGGTFSLDLTWGTDGPHLHWHAVLHAFTMKLRKNRIKQAAGAAAALINRAGAADLERLAARHNVERALRYAVKPFRIDLHRLADSDLADLFKFCRNLEQRVHSFGSFHGRTRREEVAAR